MSTIKDNLVQIREKLDTEKTQPSGGGVLEEVKKIRQVLDTDNTYPDGGGLAEEICAIRELVQDGKGGGGGRSRPDFDIQKCRITNSSTRTIAVLTSNPGNVKASNYASEYGQFGGNTISAGETSELFVASVGRTNLPSKGSDYFTLNTYSCLLLRTTGVNSNNPLSVEFSNYPKDPQYIGCVTYNQGSTITAIHYFYVTSAAASSNVGLPEVLEMTVSDAALDTR